MKVWKKTVITWDLLSGGLNTDIEVDDWHNPKEKHMHSIHEPKATSINARQVCISLKILRVSVSARPAKRQEIMRRLFTVFKDRLYNIENGLGAFDCEFEIIFNLKSGEKICETAIRIMGEIFQALKVEDKDNYYWSNFKIYQETFVCVEVSGEKKWITIADYLRQLFRMPCPIRESQSNKEENQPAAVL